MLRTAYDATKNSRYLKLQRRAFDWFLGENDLHIPLYDFKTKGCYDGLMPGGVNLNQGAESMLSFLLSLLAIVETYSIIDKIEGDKGDFLQEINLIEQISKDPTPIESISGKDKSQKRQVEELA